MRASFYAHMTCKRILKRSRRIIYALARPAKMSVLFHSHIANFLNRFMNKTSHVPKKSLPFVLILALMGAFSSCARSVPMPKIELSDAQRQIVGATRPVPETMRTSARVDFVDEKNKKRAVGQELILSADENAKLRLTVSAFDKAVAVLVTDGTTFGLFDVAQNAYLTGRATPDAISSIIPIRLSALDLHRVLFGSYPTDNLAHNALKDADFNWDSKRGGYRLALPVKHGGCQNVYYSWPEKDIFRIEVNDSNGDTVYLYEAFEFTSQKLDDVDYRFPDIIRFNLPAEKTDVQLRIDKRDLNVEFNPAVFRIMPPKGTKVLFVDG